MGTRSLMALAAGAIFFGLVTVFVSSQSASTPIEPTAHYEPITYTPGVVDNALAGGSTVVLDYAADWCVVCAAQSRELNALREANPEFSDGIVYVTVDWDEYRQHEISTARNVTRRGTLVMLRGDREIGRVVAQTGSDALREFLSLAI